MAVDGFSLKHLESSIKLILRMFLLGFFRFRQLKVKALNYAMVSTAMWRAKLYWIFFAWRL